MIIPPARSLFLSAKSNSSAVIKNLSFYVRFSALQKMQIAIDKKNPFQNVSFEDMEGFAVE